MQNNRCQSTSPSKCFIFKNAKVGHVGQTKSDLLAQDIDSSYSFYGNHECIQNTSNVSQTWVFSAEKTTKVTECCTVFNDTITALHCVHRVPVISCDFLSYCQPKQAVP